jgi:methyl-accepting chemotaxis protein
MFNKKRRNFFINKEMQGRYMMQMFVIFILCLGAVVLIFNRMSADTFTISYEDYELVLDSSPNMLWEKMASTIWIVVIGGGSVLMIVSMFLTHRLAGPLFRFEKCIKSMIEKDLTDHIKLRQNDEGKELAAQINKFNSMLESEFIKMKSIASRINQTVVELDGTLDNLEPNEKQKMTELHKDCDTLDKLLSAFKTSA